MKLNVMYVTNESAQDRTPTQKLARSRGCREDIEVSYPEPSKGYEGCVRRYILAFRSTSWQMSGASLRLCPKPTTPWRARISALLGDDRRNQAGRHHIEREITNIDTLYRTEGFSGPESQSMSSASLSSCPLGVVASDTSHSVSGLLPGQRFNVDADDRDPIQDVFRI